MSYVIDLKAIRGPTAGELAELQGYLLQLEGQPFLFARVTYGDEFTLHFGTLQETVAKKTRRTRGSYVLTARASSWRLHSMPLGRILYHGTLPANVPSTHLSEQEFEGSALIAPDARVASADILGFHTPWGIE